MPVEADRRLLDLQRLQIAQECRVENRWVFELWPMPDIVHFQESEEPGQFFRSDAFVG